VYDIDGFDNPASTVAALHHAGDRVICYVEVGRSNRTVRLLEVSRLRLGDDVPDIPMNVPRCHSFDGASIVESRIAMCKLKGFDAVEPDIDDSYSDRTDFRLRRRQISLTIGPSPRMRIRLVCLGQKNGDADGVFSQSLERQRFRH